MSTDVIAIPPATGTPNHLRRNIAIGTSIGTAFFLLLASLAAIFAIRRRRQKAITQLGNETTDPPTPFREPRALIVSSPREIGQNSMVGPVRELPNSAKAKEELLNEQAPSGSGNEIAEMSEALAPVSEELRNNRSSRVMVQTRNPNRCKIFTSTKISRKSWPSFASSDGVCVETVISASAQRREMDVDRASIITSSLEAEIYSLYTRKSIDLYRSLPPTPISESPQLSPILVKMNDRSPFRQRPQMVETSTRGSMSAFVSPQMPALTYPATISKHQRLPVSVLLTGLEVIIPPGQSRTNESRFSVTPREKCELDENWF